MCEWRETILSTEFPTNGKYPIPYWRRAIADAVLVSRMKIRQTNARIDDLAESVDEAVTADAPVNIHEKIMESVLDSLKKTIRAYITPDDLEEAVCWYMKKKGADPRRGIFLTRQGNCLRSPMSG